MVQWILVHAMNIKWYEGGKILIDQGIGLIMGSGLASINIEKFKNIWKLVVWFFVGVHGNKLKFDFVIEIKKW